MNEDFSKGLNKTLGFFLEMKIYGDVENPLEESLREKFLNQLTKFKISDGRTNIKISELELVYEIPSFDFEGLKKIAKKRIKKRGKDNE